MKTIKNYSLLLFSIFLIFQSSSIIGAPLADMGDELASTTDRMASDIGEDSAAAARESAGKMSKLQETIGSDTKAIDEIGQKSRAVQDQMAKVKEATGAARDSEMSTLRSMQDDLDGTIAKHTPKEDLGEGAKPSEQRSLDRADDAAKKAEEEGNPKKAKKIREAQGKLDRSIEERDAAIKEHGPNSEEARAAQEKVESAQKDLDKTLDDAAKGPGTLSKIGHWLADQLPMVAIFTVPNLLIGAIQAESARLAALKSAMQAIQVGNWVIQLPETCLDAGAPAESFPMYVAIPVKNLGDPVSDSASKAFNGSVASIPDKSFWEKGKFGPALRDIGELGGLVSSAGHFINRYAIASASHNPQLMPDLYKHTMFVATYPEQYYNKIAQSLATSAQASGLLIDLKTGLAVDATGEPYSAAYPVPLLPMKLHNPQIQQQPVEALSKALPGILARMKGAGLTSSYSTATWSTSQGPSVSDLLAAWFDCDDATGQSLVKGKESVIEGALDQYSAGIHSVGVFGAMVPIFGWGEHDYAKIINSTNFPHNVPLSFNQAGVVVTDLGKAFGSHQKAAAKAKGSAGESASVRVYAPKKNYAAEGCWIYLATHTPFVKDMQPTAKQLSPVGPYVDYVIFFDEGMNQVPLQIPVNKPIPGVSGDIKWPAVGLNPNIKYMASLLSTGLADFQVEYQGKRIPVMYELDGGKASMADLSDKVGQAIQQMQQAFPTLFDQFEAHRNALISQYHFGPFIYGKDRLTDLSEYSVAVDQGQSTISLKFYKGAYCLGSDVSAVMLPMGGTGTAVLPSNKVNHFIDLVTDIEWEVLPDKSLKASNFDHAPGTWDGKTFAPNSKAANKFYWFDVIAGNKGANQADIKKLQQYLVQQRNAWLSSFDGSELSQGISVGNLHFTLPGELNSKEVIANKCFIYHVSPSPSALLTERDWFVVIDSPKPSLENFNLVDISQGVPEGASLVSLATGKVYDMTGKPRTSRNRPLVVTTTGAGQQGSTSQHLYTYMNTMYPAGNGMSLKFQEQYKDAVESYTEDINRPIMQQEFAGIHLAIYADDLAAGNYVYFNAAGMTVSENFVPKDLFVTVNTAGGKTTFGAQLTKSTEYIVSIISGQIYSRSGPSGEMSRKTVWNFANGQGFYWRSTLREIFEKQKLSYLSTKAMERKEVEALVAEQDQGDQKVLLTQSQAQSIIGRLSKPLPAPYSTLRQDPVTQMFVHVTSAEVGGETQYSYTFFNLPNNYKDREGKPVSVGGIYNQEGKLEQKLTGTVLEAMKHQFGLYGEAEKTLGVPVTQPSMLMSAKDRALKPGQNGETMIVSTSKDFPGRQVKMPADYYLYYSLVMDTYYVFSAQKNYWMSVVGGYMYDRNGRPIPKKHKVGVNVASSARKDDLLLMEDTPAGRMQGMMQNPYHNNDFTNFVNDGTGQWKSMYGAATVVQDAKRSAKTRGGAAKGSVYTVLFENSSKTRQERRTYEEDPAYRWESMSFLPIGSDDELLSAMPGISYRSARVVKKGDAIEQFVFNGLMHTVAPTSQAGVYKITPVNQAAGEPAILQMLVDENTNAPYAKVTVGMGATAEVYKYGYEYDQLPEAQQSSLRALIKGDVTVCPAQVQVGPMITREVKVSGRDLTIKHPTGRTYVQFASDIENAKTMASVNPGSVLETPARDSADYAPFTSMLFRVYKSDDGRFFASMYPKDGKSFHEPFVSYFNRNGYADLETGALFDEEGRAVGYSLRLEDWLNLLNKLQVTVNKSADGKVGLYYRRAATIKTQIAQQTTTQSVAPSQPRVDTSALGSNSLGLRTASAGQAASTRQVDSDLKATASAYQPTRRAVAPAVSRTAAPSRSRVAPIRA